MEEAADPHIAKQIKSRRDERKCNGRKRNEKKHAIFNFLAFVSFFSVRLHFFSASWSLIEQRAFVCARAFVVIPLSGRYARADTDAYASSDGGGGSAK